MDHAALVAVIVVVVVVVVVLVKESPIDRLIERYSNSREARCFVR